MIKLRFKEYPGGQWEDWSQYLVQPPSLSKKIESERPGEAGLIAFDTAALSLYCTEGSPVALAFNRDLTSVQRYLFEVYCPDSLGVQIKIFEGIADFSTIERPDYSNELHVDLVDKLSALAVLVTNKEQLQRYSAYPYVGTGQYTEDNCLTDYATITKNGQPWVQIVNVNPVDSQVIHHQEPILRPGDIFVIWDIVNQKERYHLVLKSERGSTVGFSGIAQTTHLKLYPNDISYLGEYSSLTTPKSMDFYRLDYYGLGDIGVYNFTGEFTSFNGLKIIELLVKQQWPEITVVNKTGVQSYNLPLEYYDQFIGVNPFNSDPLAALKMLADSLQCYMYIDRAGSFVIQSRKNLAVNGTLRNLGNTKKIEGSEKYFWDKIVDGVDVKVKSWIYENNELIFGEASIAKSIPGSTMAVKPRNGISKEVLAPASNLTTKELLNAYAASVASEDMAFYGTRHSSIPVTLDLDDNVLQWEILDRLNLPSGDHFFVQMDYDLVERTVQLELISIAGSDYYPGQIVVPNKSTSTVSSGGFSSSRSGGGYPVFGDPYQWSGTPLGLDAVLARQSLGLQDISKIGSGLVTTANFNFLHGLTSSVQDHIISKANPHETNKTHIGLGNVDNVKQEPFITAGAVNQYFRGDKTMAVLDKAAVGLNNLDNVKQEPFITAGSAAQYMRGDKSWATLDKAAVGLGNLDNVRQEPHLGVSTVDKVLRGDRTWGSISESVRSAISATAPVLYNSATGVISLDYDATNIKLTANKLNTVQDLATTSSPTFLDLTITGTLHLQGGISNTGTIVTSGGAVFGDTVLISGNLGVGGTVTAIDVSASNAITADSITTNGLTIMSGSVLGYINAQGAFSKTWIIGNDVEPTQNEITLQFGSLGNTKAYIKKLADSKLLQVQDTFQVLGLTTLSTLNVTDLNVSGNINFANFNITGISGSTFYLGTNLDVSLNDFYLYFGRNVDGHYLKWMRNTNRLVASMEFGTVSSAYIGNDLVVTHAISGESLTVSANASITGNLTVSGVITAGGANSTQWKAAYDHSLTPHLSADVVLNIYTQFGTDPDSDIMGTYDKLVIKNDSHDHDYRYFTEAEITAMLATYQPLITPGANADYFYNGLKQMSIPDVTRLQNYSTLMLKSDFTSFFQSNFSAVGPLYYVGTQLSLHYAGNLALDGSGNLNTVASPSFSNISMGGSLTVINKAGLGYLNLATRNTTGAEAVYDLSNVGSIIASDYIQTARNIFIATNGYGIKFNGMSNAAKGGIFGSGDVVFIGSWDDGAGRFTINATSGLSAITGTLNISKDMIFPYNALNHKIQINSASSWWYDIATSNDDLLIKDAQSVEFLRMVYNGGSTNKYLSLLGKFFVKNNGNVGVGISSPAQQLHQQSAGDVWFRQSRNNGAYYWDLGFDSNSNYLFKSQTGGTIMTLGYDGKVGIGRTPTANKLEVSGNIQSVGGNIVLSDGYNLLWGSSNNAIANSGGDTIFYTGDGSRRLTITSLGHIYQSGNISFYNNFASGWTGTGFRLDNGVNVSGKSTLEVDYLIVRKNLNVYELLINQYRATNGSQIFSAVSKVKAVNGTIITLENPDNSAVCPFTVGALIEAQVKSQSGVQTRIVQATVSAVNGFDITVTYSAGTFAIGDIIVRKGHTTDANLKGYIVITSDDSGAPYIRVVDGVASIADQSDLTKLKTQIGRLDGLTSSAFGALSGYGGYLRKLYAEDEVKIAGDLYALTGGFGGSVSDPAVKVTSNGLYVLSSAAAGTVSDGAYLGNWTASASFSGAILNSAGLYGYRLGANAFSLDATTARIAGFDFDNGKFFKDNFVLNSAGYIAFGATPPSAYGNIAGAFLGSEAGYAKLSLYYDSNNYFQWDGTKPLLKSQYFQIGSDGSITASSGAFTGAIAVGGQMVIEGQGSGTITRKVVYGETIAAGDILKVVGVDGSARMMKITGGDYSLTNTGNMTNVPLIVLSPTKMITFTGSYPYYLATITYSAVANTMTVGAASLLTYNTNGTYALIPFDETRFIYVYADSDADNYYLRARTVTVEGEILTPGAVLTISTMAKNGSNYAIRDIAVSQIPGKGAVITYHGGPQAYPASYSAEIAVVNGELTISSAVTLLAAAGEYTTATYIPYYVNHNCIIYYRIQGMGGAKTLGGLAINFTPTVYRIDDSRLLILDGCTYMYIGYITGNSLVLSDQTPTGLTSQSALLRLEKLDKDTFVGYYYNGNGVTSTSFVRVAVGGYIPSLSEIKQVSTNAASTVFFKKLAPNTFLHCYGSLFHVINDDYSMFTAIAQEAGLAGQTKKVAFVGTVSQVHSNLIQGHSYGFTKASPNKLVIDYDEGCRVGIALSSADLFVTR